MTNLSHELSPKGVPITLDRDDDDTIILKYGDRILFAGEDLTVNNREFERLYHAALADDIQEESEPVIIKKRKAR